MSDSPEVTPTEVTTAEADPIHFPEVVTLRPCTFEECINGHRWAPMLTLARCGYGKPNGWNGCASPMLAVKLSACPVCNEPAHRFQLRIDHTGPAPFPVPLCIPGSATNAEVNVMRVEWRKTKETEDALLAKYKEEIKNGQSQGIQEQPAEADGCAGVCSNERDTVPAV